MELAMATKRDLTKKYAAEYGRALKKEKGRMLDELCAATGWSRVNARRAIWQAAAPTCLMLFEHVVIVGVSHKVSVKMPG
jgi:hypothetical protein